MCLGATSHLRGILSGPSVRRFPDLGQPDSCGEADRSPGLNPGRLSNDPRFLGELRWKPLTFAEAS